MTRSKFIALTIISLIASTLIVAGIDKDQRIYFMIASCVIYLVFIVAMCARNVGE